MSQQRLHYIALAEGWLQFEVYCGFVRIIGITRNIRKATPLSDAYKAADIAKQALTAGYSRSSFYCIMQPSV